LITFPNAKINIGLRVTEKRPDGYHNIETCFYPVQWCDALEMVESDSTVFQSTGLAIPGDEAQNLCLKAYHLLEKTFALPRVRIHLHKVIPIGAGLGGGSADAAFMLKMLNEFFDLGMDVTDLSSYAEQLGSDCAFYLRNQPSIGKGKGALLHDIGLDLSHYTMVLIYPDIQVSTSDAYAGVTPRRPDPNESVDQVVTEMPPESWREVLINDFERSVFKRYPELGRLKNYLYDEGAVYASMSGSGSVIYGIFDAKPTLDLPGNYTVWMG
jgi:4-diphosphocytidyl-2-C-methyl-D-erythritol kinase